MIEIETENTSGGHLEGLEFCRKGEDRLKEKIAEKLEHEPNRAPSETIRQINDAVRYTFCYEPSNYSDGYRDIQQRLEAHGYKMIYSKNYWNDPEYKGINTRWGTPGGQRFEVQFHTSESFCAKHEVTHLAYERLRNPLTTSGERQELEAFQREVSSWIVVPSRAISIPDYPRKGHG